MNEMELAKVICRAYLEKTFEGFQGGAEPAVRLALEREVALRWQKFLPEARAVIKWIQ